MFDYVFRRDHLCFEGRLEPHLVSVGVVSPNLGQRYAADCWCENDARNCRSLR